MSEGLKAAWEIIRQADPADLEQRASVEYRDGAYALESFGMEFLLRPETAEIVGTSPEAEAVVKKLGYFVNFSMVWYLANARDIRPAGRLVRPEQLSGGDIFFKGSHVLPLPAIEKKYGHDKEGFLAKAHSLGAVDAGPPGDASVTLKPLPRVPVNLILWLGDEEFPPRADILLDSTSELLLALDVVWSTAMLSTLIML